MLGSYFGPFRGFYPLVNAIISPDLPRRTGMSETLQSLNLQFVVREDAVNLIVGQELNVLSIA